MLHEVQETPPEAVEPKVEILTVDPTIFEKKKGKPRGTPKWKELRLHELAVGQMIEIVEDRKVYTKAKNAMLSHKKDGQQPYKGRVLKARKGNDGKWYYVRMV